jgi:hypothetical protein
MRLSTKPIATAAAVVATAAGLMTVGAAPASAAGGTHYPIDEEIPHASGRDRHTGCR